jgi:hypothetical protein
MSPKSKKAGGYSPAPTEPGSLTVAQIKELGIFFKDLVESTHLKWFIIFAGIGGLFEAIHLVWLAVRHFLGR